MIQLKRSAAFLMAAAMIVFTGCSGASNASSGSSSASSSAVSAAAKGTTVKIALGSEPDSLDPMLSAATDTGSVMMNVFEGLLAFDQKGEFVPAIAESYTVSGDGLTYTFQIKSGIHFHDGKDCTAQDVKYTYDKLSGLGGAKALNSTLAAELAKVECPDDHTAVITLKSKDAGFLSKVAGASIVENGYDQNATKPIGTGPYKFVEYVKGQKVVLEKNGDYTTIAGRKPNVDRVEFVIMTDENAKLMALKSGDLDIAGVNANDVKALSGDFTIVQGPQNMVQTFGLNNKVKPLDNLKVRQAICYAVDKDEIIGSVSENAGVKLQSFLSPSMAIYYSNDIRNAYTTDDAKAKELLKEAGYPNGFDLTVTVPSNYQFHVDTAEVIKNQLAKVGINVKIQKVEWAQWLDGVYTKRNYQATVIGHSGKLDPQDFMNRFSSTYARNYFNFSDPDYDKLIKEGASATDEASRAKIYRECQQMLVDQAASVFIQDPYVIYAMNKRVQGLKIYPVTFFNLCDLTAAS